MLTKARIEKATPPTKGRTVLWDHELPGFGCRVAASGRRSFIVSYRLRGTRRAITATIGTYGVLTLPQARDKARELLAKVRLGVDPLAEQRARAKAEQAVTVADLVAQYADALKAGTASSTRLKGRSASEGYIEDTLHYLYLFTRACGRQNAASVTRADAVELLNEYIRRPATYRHLRGAISRLYDWALRHELVPANPAERIESTTAPARERVLSLEELARIWRAAEQLEPLYSDTVKLMITTGQRRAEVAGMQWGEIDLARALWTIPATRTKARRQHVLPLPPLAVAVLQARHAAFQHAPAANDLVLPTLARDGHSIAPISGWNWLKRELDRTAGVTAWRLHDFRRSIVTICAEHGAEVAVLDSMLNHASSATRGGVIGTYQRATLVEPMRKIMALWEGLLRDALGLSPAAVGPQLISAA